MTLQNYIELRNKVPFSEVSLGYQTVILFPPDKIKEEQLGYSVGQAGEDFTGEQDGDWKKSWLVIARDDSVGDPIFIDLQLTDFPVFTAMHGAGEWKPVKIASSFTNFVLALEEIKRISHGRTSPVELERNPISDAERKQALDRILEINKDIDLEFWELWFLE